jgi:hypothetical protein
MGPVIGLLWGDFPWEERDRKVGKLLSTGAVGRTTTRAAGGEVLPYTPPTARRSISGRSPASSSGSTSKASSSSGGTGTTAESARCGIHLDPTAGETDEGGGPRCTSHG